MKDHPLFFNRANQRSSGFVGKCGPLSEQHRQALPAAHLGKKASLKTRAKMSATRRGVPLTPRQRQASAARALSAEAREKMSLASKGHPVSPERLEKMRQRRHSEKTRQKMVDSAKARWQKHRQEHQKIYLMPGIVEAEHKRKIRESIIVFLTKNPEGIGFTCLLFSSKSVIEMYFDEE